MPQNSSLIASDASAVERTAALFEAIEAKQDLNAYVTLMKDDAGARAHDSDARRQSGDEKPLDGVLVAVKDNFCTRGVRSTAGSKILENFTPPYESFVTQKLRDAGAILTGKTNLDEFGMGSSTEKGMFPATVNPNLRNDGVRVVPGGSSGGSAAAVAADLADAAIGTDTGGSLRQPAAFCGVVGVKPTYGFCSRWGVMAYASSLDQPGVVTKSVGAAAEMLDVIVAQDPRDSTSIDYSGPAFAEGLKTPAERPYRVGLPKELIGDRSETVALIWDQIRTHCGAAGVEIVDVSIPSLPYALPSYYIIALSEASSNLARYDGMRYGLSVDENLPLNAYYETVRARGFGAEVLKRIMIGTYALSSGYYDQYYLRATKVRRKLSDEFMRACEGVDALAWPTAPTEAFEFGSDDKDPLTMYLQDVFTVPVNLVGAPAASLPVANSSNGLPLGMQIIGKPQDDLKVLQIAQALERVIEYKRPCAD